VTKALTENSGILLRAGVVVAGALSLGVWFNTRLSAVEAANLEVRKDVQYTQDSVREIKSDLKEVLRRLPQSPHE
jgi:hypothetical protein